MIVALTRRPDNSLAFCELSYVERQEIDPGAAADQHAAYEQCLASLGCRIERVADAPGLPDAVFVEDTAVVFPEVAVMARHGSERRRAEIPSVAARLGKYRDLRYIRAPATLDGGDVLCAGKSVYVGLSGRTNAAAAGQLAEILAPLGYTVKEVPVDRCLHLKTAACCIADQTVMINPEWVDFRAFRDLDIIPIHADEPFAANALRAGTAVVVSSNCPRTRRRLEQRGFEICPVDISELEKAEAGVTCCSLLLEDGA